MTRACLDCGTPKFANFSSCFACDKETLDYQGPAKKQLCFDCKHFDQKKGCVDLEWYMDRTKTREAFVNRAARAVLPKPNRLSTKVTRHIGECEWFEARSRDYKPAEHPIPYQDRLDIALYQFNTLAFWLAPERWDGVEDPRTQAMSCKPERTNPVAALGWTALAAAALVLLPQAAKSTK